MNIQEACLNRYPSPQSRRRIGYELNRLAQLFQIASVNDIDWPKFTRATIGAVLARPELISRKAASQNFTLSVIKGLCEEACFQQLMPLEQYFAIERIPNFRGNSQHGSPCLSSDDIRQLLQGCISGGTPKDIRDAAELRSSLWNFESQNEYGYKPCIKRRFQNTETLQSRNLKNSSLARQSGTDTNRGCSSFGS